MTSSFRSSGYPPVMTEPSWTEQPEERRFSLRYFRDGRLIAVDSINDPRSHMLARRALAEPQGGKAES